MCLWIRLKICFDFIWLMGKGFLIFLAKVQIAQGHLDKEGKEIDLIYFIVWKDKYTSLTCHKFTLELKVAEIGKGIKTET